MNEIERLVAIEAISRLKAHYFHCVDLQNWMAWETEVWAPDAELHVPDFREEPFVGAATITKWSAQMMAGKVSIHHGHTPRIDILSPTEARGLWAMEDRIYPATAGPTAGFIHGWGHYHEIYVKLPQGWRIRHSKLTRLRMETPPEAPGK